MASTDTENKSSRRAVRVAIGVLAALVIAFCGWSAAEYAAGRDPLAFLGGSAFQTVAEDSGSAEGDSAVSLKTTSNTVTANDVSAQISKLTYGKDDVSVTADKARVVLSDGGIWVENATDADAASAVRDAARRAAALAAWADDQQVSLAHVVWIAEDMAGSVRVVIDYPVSRASKNETTAQILSAANGYRISGDTYAALGSDADFKQSAGEAPCLPDGNQVTVISDKTSTGEVLEATSETYTVFTTETSTSSSASSSSSSNSGSGSSSNSNSGSVSNPGSSSQSNASGSTDSKITVAVTVDGSAVGAGSSSASVAVAPGSSVYDALEATGVSINATDTQYGVYVSAIGGLAEKEYGSTSGWMYSVNGVTPMTSCGNYKLSDGDTVVWHYVTGD